MLRKRLIAAFTELGYDEFREIQTGDIVFAEDVFNQCARNTCGNYGKNHACPPGAGSLDERKAQILKYKNAFLLNKILSIGSRQEMTESVKVLEQTKNELIKQFEGEDVIVLGAGPCKLCQTCTALEGKTCRFPEKTQYSMEGAGIDVVRMSMNHKMIYNAGKGKVGFFNLVLYND